MLSLSDALLTDVSRHLGRRALSGIGEGIPSLKSQARVPEAFPLLRGHGGLAEEKQDLKGFSY